ncbi:pentatricopeptide repeat-containing protein At4g21065 isoform X1 [Elaeis guineensis]|uniref:pentatricopeptide repeat-containing protein At4g21065 isoform X1 n=1 Tax=Elaeis guineensis var. tenera TaxID=51953 RepID=UPI003C6CD5D6
MCILTQIYIYIYICHESMLHNPVAMTLSSNWRRHIFGSFRRLSVVPFLLRQQTYHCSQPSYDPTNTKEELDGSYHSQEQSLISLFQSCSTMRDLSQIHSQIIRTGFDQHVFVVGRAITFCCVSEHGSMDYALAVFEQLQWPDGFIWNTMIRGFGRTSRAEEAFLFFQRMRQKGKVADNFTFSFLLKICGQLTAVDLGRQIHCCVLKHGLDSHVYVTNTLIHMYGLFEDMNPARRVFEEMPNIDVVSWNTLIDGYVNCGQYKEALRMLLIMKRSGFGPDEATLVLVLSACSELGALDFGKWVHSGISSSILNQSISVLNSLIDMYAKCGAIDRALRVFDYMKERNIVSWNSMILGLAMHGHADEALRLFDRMQKTEIEEPNDITFLGVLCACSHGGLVEEGQRFFDSMGRDYGITPTIKHYGCMVDLLGRAGLVKEAYELLRSMPMEGNAVVWRTLLGACRIHGDLELGERVRKHLEELEPDHSSDYVLLSHMYAGAGRWNDVLKVRESMKGRGVQKPEPGELVILFTRLKEGKPPQSLQIFSKKCMISPEQAASFVPSRGSKENDMFLC